MFQKIIAFSGHKQSGKTTATNYLYEIFTEDVQAVEIINFADSLKFFVQDYFCPSGKHWADIFEEKSKNTMLSCGKTVREVLQIVGTDWFRTLDPDYWVNKWRIKVLQSRTEIILVGDVRFPNEIRAIQSLGGKVIRLMRNPFPEDKHVSETALNDVHLAFDWLMQNSSMPIQEQNYETAIAIQHLFPEFGTLFNGK